MFIIRIHFWRPFVYTEEGGKLGPYRKIEIKRNGEWCPDEFCHITKGDVFRYEETPNEEHVAADDATRCPVYGINNEIVDLDNWQVTVNRIEHKLEDW